jgi:hypothetical protein
VLEWDSHACASAHSRSGIPAIDVRTTSIVSRQIDLNGRRYWILSEPHGSEWKASVVELIDPSGRLTEPVGLEATAQTRGAADEAAERKLRRLLNTPSR